MARKKISAGVVALSGLLGAGVAAGAQRVLKPKTFFGRVSAATVSGGGVGALTLLSKKTRGSAKAAIPLGAAAGGAVGSLEKFGDGGARFAGVLRGESIPEAPETTRTPPPREETPSQTSTPAPAEREPEKSELEIWLDFAGNLGSTAIETFGSNVQASQGRRRSGVRFTY